MRAQTRLGLLSCSGSSNVLCEVIRLLRSNAAGGGVFRGSPGLAAFNCFLRWLGACCLRRALFTSLHTLRDGPWRSCIGRSCVCCAQATALAAWTAGAAAYAWLCECRHSPGMRQTCHSPHAESAHIHTHAVDEAAAQRARLGGSSSPRSSYYFV